MSETVTCWWCGNPKTLIGFGRIAVDTKAGNMSTVHQTRRACTDHVHDLIVWMQECQDEP